MSADVAAAIYDDIAPNYSNAAEVILLRPYVEQPSFLGVLGSVQDQTVLDLACGDGHYTRLFKKRGAARVVGVDLSLGMIEAARRIEQVENRGIDYQVHDAASLPALGSFDVITAVWLLLYAQSADHLSAICQRIYENLKPGGRLVTYTLNPAFDPQGQNTTKYGYSLNYPAHRVDGSQMSFVVHSNPPVSVSCRYWSRHATEQALTAAGFRDIVWIPPRVTEEGERQYGSEFWQDYIGNPDGVVLSCRSGRS